jgi:hypothetical protein
MPRFLITGAEEPDTRAHGANESLHLTVFERARLAETLPRTASATSRDKLKDHDTQNPR